MSEEKKHIDLAEIAPWLKKPKRMLDIGCGNGIVDELVAKANPQIEKFHLLDGSTIRRSVQGYSPEPTETWNNVWDAHTRLEPLVPEVIVHQPNQKNYDFDELDTVISLKSWGFHYPIQTYLMPVKRHLKLRGRLVVDLRKEYRLDHFETLALNGFRLVEMDVGRSWKCFRSVWDRVKEVKPDDD